ncbi:hypothetical protein OIU34_02325 [Pararhizobium sp. BT-229]|uniref:TipJ family phage tail tip protein n=1 Tax=Pararhizobium sp. BT-229 TaxID=2986923 RepID=UPI0021F7C652|nr:hypothetical protein [Pararhizobium sp. BT-229]MCV9960723.1 hypothetical protein [Pararhizobium sp. BT-229]
MKRKLLNLPAIEPGEAFVHVTVMPLFDPKEGRIRFVAPHGKTVGEIIAMALPASSPSLLHRVRVTLVRKAGLAPVDRNLWHVVRPKTDVHVVIRVVPAGNAMQSVLQLLITVAATAITGPLGLGLTGFLRTFATFAIVAAGGLLLNSLFMPSQAGQDKEKPTYAISGWRNQSVPDGFVPLVAGKVRYAPRYAASTWTEVVGDLIYIRSAFLWGYGPLAITGLKIGDTPLDKFDEETVETQYGAAGDDPFTLYPRQVIEESVGAELVLEAPLDDYGEPTDDPPEEKPVTRFTAADAAEACVIFYFEGGLFNTDDEGKQSSKTVEVELATRLVGAPDFDVVETIKFDEEKTKGFFRAFRWTLKNHAGVATRGRYEVQLIRKTKNDENIGDQDALKWFALQSFRPESPFNFPKAHAKSLVRVKATNQLNGTLDALNGVVSAELRDWNGTTWVPAIESSNPASFSLRAITGPHLAYPSSDEEIDWPAFEDWHEHCTANDLKYDRVHDFENGLGDVLSASGAAGRAAVWHDGEKWTVTIDRPRTIIDDHISSRNASNFRWSTKYFTPPDACRVTFLDATNDYLEAERIVPWPADVRYATKALMDADLAHRAGKRAEVYADPTPANNAYYRKSGASGAGSWIIKPIDITEALDLPGVTHPDQIWIETRRLQYERIYRNTVYSATQAGSIRRAAPGSAVMLARDVLVKRMHSGRVTAVVGKRIETDAVFIMEEGKDYGLRFRVYANDDDGFGVSTLRTLRAVPGENRAVSVTGEGEMPEIGSLVHFGPIAQESIPVIVAGIERGNDNTSILQMLPAADEMHAKVAAEVPPAWSGRVGDNLGGSNAEPPVPVVTAVRSGISGTGDADGLYVRLRPAAGSAVIVGEFEIQHRLAGAGTWGTPVSASASSGVVVIPGYFAGDEVEWQPRAVSINNIPSDWGSTRTTTIGEDDPAAPGALDNSLIVVTGGLGKADIFFTVAPSEANTTHVQLYHNTIGSLDPVDDAILAPIDVDAGGSYTRVHGDPSIVTLVTNGSFSAPASPPTLGSNWTITSGHADHAPGTGGSISWSVPMSPGDEICLSVLINSISGGALTPRSTGTLTETWATAYTTPGLKLQSHVAGSANPTLGLLAATATACQIDDFAAYKKTPACLSQGNNYFWLQPFNGVTPGPVAGPFLITVR